MFGLLYNMKICPCGFFFLMTFKGEVGERNLKLLAKCFVHFWTCGVVVSTVASLQEGSWLDSWAGSFCELNKGGIENRCMNDLLCSEGNLQ